MIPSLFIMGLLASHCKASLPESSLLTEWKAKYLEIYDDQIDGLSPQGDYKQKRRRTITNTFNKVIRLSRRQEERREETRKMEAEYDA